MKLRLISSSPSDPIKLCSSAVTYPSLWILMMSASTPYPKGQGLLCVILTNIH